METLLRFGQIMEKMQPTEKKLFDFRSKNDFDKKEFQINHWTFWHKKSNFNGTDKGALFSETNKFVNIFLVHVEVWKMDAMMFQSTNG